jgi:uncharacterized membrane protein YbhN (UPF0104 family)
MPGPAPPLSDLPLLTACLALAIVAGFVSFIPGGLGVRELVTIPLLGVALGYEPTTALVSAVLLRLCWLLSEVFVLIILYVVTRLTLSRPG